MSICILDVELQQAQSALLGQLQRVSGGVVRGAVWTEGTTLHGVAIVGQRPVESHMILQIKEVVAVLDADYAIFDGRYKGTSVVMLYLIVVGQRCTVGI